MILLDLFSGIGGFHKGLTDAGIPITKTYFSEIDKHAIANYKYNYPNATHIGTVTDILNTGIERPDIITFGSPCQDFSLAGKRTGLGGDRSSLIEYAISSVSHFRPTVFIWENVKGTFSSNFGADFWAILQRFANIGGYHIEWQLLNTKWVLPQNRERIYLVGRLADRCRGEVFPIGENDELFDKQTKPNSGRTQTEICGTLKVGFGNKADDTYIIQRPRGNNKGGTFEECPTISANAFEQNNHVQIGTYRNYKNEKGIREMKNGLSPTITGNASRKYGGNPVIIGYTRDSKGKVVKRHIKHECETLTSSAGGTGNTAQFVQEKRIRRLTEIECEILQGYTPNYTKYGNYDGTVKEIPATQRYKMLGNSVTAKIVELVGTRIKQNTNI